MPDSKSSAATAAPIATGLSGFDALFVYVKATLFAVGFVASSSTAYIGPPPHCTEPSGPTKIPPPFELTFVLPPIQTPPVLLLLTINPGSESLITCVVFSDATAIVVLNLAGCVP